MSNLPAAVSTAIDCAPDPGQSTSRSRKVSIANYDLISMKAFGMRTDNRMNLARRILVAGIILVMVCGAILTASPLRTNVVAADGPSFPGASADGLQYFPQNVTHQNFPPVRRVGHSKALSIEIEEPRSNVDVELTQPQIAASQDDLLTQNGTTTYDDAPSELDALLQELQDDTVEQPVQKVTPADKPAARTAENDNPFESFERGPEPTEEFDAFTPPSVPEPKRVPPPVVSRVEESESDIFADQDVAEPIEVITPRPTQTTRIPVIQQVDTSGIETALRDIRSEMTRLIEGRDNDQMTDQAKRIRQLELQLRELQVKHAEASRPVRVELELRPSQNGMVTARKVGGDSNAAVTQEVPIPLAEQVPRAPEAPQQLVQPEYAFPAVQSIEPDAAAEITAEESADDSTVQHEQSFATGPIVESPQYVPPATYSADGPVVMYNTVPNHSAQGVCPRCGQVHGTTNNVIVRPQVRRQSAVQRFWSRLVR